MRVEATKAVCGLIEVSHTSYTISPLCFPPHLLPFFNPLLFSTNSKHEATHTALLPYLGDVLNQFFCIMNEAGTDIVVIALEKVITKFEVYSAAVYY